ncbi:DUF4920 domain-containing protein [Maribacter arcticus]|jgi:hypothetical protein|uniref:DUF4920 domain-containing protein n=1 Tax=Maribacter arcticus TaxID=561365 RepID=A0A1T4ZVU9_9FLAO|nr:DUF4920 domain-containing protein [Maribacter arcticus]SKB26727.1 protein of unknown function [Maribacter arcticus]|tara:strand:- start:494 stop:991 length:498 start_codon:yes stop_codon:yes gene_type:complete
MKGFNILLVFLFGFFSCFAQKDSKILPSKDTNSGTYYGEEFTVDAVDLEKEVWQKYTSMAISDSLHVQFKTKVKEVCKVKGCWMIVELPEGEQAMVRFKNYGFFMPSDISEKEVVLNGLAFVEEMSVEDQKHYAKDASKSADEIAKILTPKRTFSFEASGVLVPN